MRILLLALCLALHSSLASAQGEVGTKEVLFNQLNKKSRLAATEYTTAIPAAKTNADRYNAKVDKANDERELWLRRNAVYENVVSLRKKDEVMTFLDEQRRKLGVDEQKGYQRLGIYNPYDFQSYVRYYDQTTGELVIGEVRALYDGLVAARNDFENTRSTIEADRSAAQRQYDQVTKLYNEAIVASNAASTAEQELRDAQVAAAEAEQERQSQERLYDMQKDPPIFGDGPGQVDFNNPKPLFRNAR